MWRMNGLRKVFPECKDVTLDEVYADLLFEAPAGRPYTAINMVSSVDGRTTVGGRAHSPALGSERDRQLMSWVRHAADVVMRGAQTVRANPVYPSIPEGLVPVRLQKGLLEQPKVAIVTNSCDLPLDAPVFTDGPWRPIVITSRLAPKDKVAAVEECADVLFAGEDAVEPTLALQILRSEFGIERILLEGGPTLNYHFLRQRVVDELFWTVAPKMIGGADELALVEGRDVFDPLVQLKLISAYTYADELFLRYEVL